MTYNNNIGTTKYDFKEKRQNVQQMNKYMLAKTLSMFEYEGLPESIPVRELERLLQTSGYAFITRAPDGELYALNGGMGGLPDAYYNPTEIVIANPALDFYKTLNIKNDGVLVRNDDLELGVLRIYEKYHTMLAENDINITLDGYSTRMNTLISATDDKTKESAESYIKKVINGEISIIGENALFDGVKVQGNSNGAGSSISRLIELTQYLKGSLYNEVGLSSNFNMKKERLITAEIEQQEDGTFPFVYNMMKCRIKGFERVNEMFGTAIDVDFGSVWNIKNREFVDDVIEDDLSEEHIPHGAIESVDLITEDLSDEVIDEPIIVVEDEIEDEPVIVVEDEPVIIVDDVIEDEVIEDEIVDEVIEPVIEDEVIEVIVDEVVDEVIDEIIEIIEVIEDEVIDEPVVIEDEDETESEVDINITIDKDNDE